MARVLSDDPSCRPVVVSWKPLMVSPSKLRTEVGENAPRRSCEPMTASILGTGAFAPKNIVSSLSLVESRGIDRFGNTIAASIPIALDEALASGRAERGDYVMLVGFGAGLSWGGNLLRL